MRKIRIVIKVFKGHMIRASPRFSIHHHIRSRNFLSKKFMNHQDKKSVSLFVKSRGKNFNQKICLSTILQSRKVLTTKITKMTNASQVKIKS